MLEGVAEVRGPAPGPEPELDVQCGDVGEPRPHHLRHQGADVPRVAHPPGRVRDRARNGRQREPGSADGDAEVGQPTRSLDTDEAGRRPPPRVRDEDEDGLGPPPVVVGLLQPVRPDAGMSHRRQPGEDGTGPGIQEGCPFPLPPVGRAARDQVDPGEHPGPHAARARAAGHRAVRDADLGELGRGRQTVLR